MRAPKLVEDVTPEIEDVPLLVILPEARGVPAVGRILIPDQVIEAVHEFEVLLVILIVIVETVGVTVWDMLPLINKDRFPLQDPLTLFLAAVTLLVVVAKVKPEGTFNIIVPIPISPVAPSWITGPVSVVNVPLAEVSAETLALANVVTVTAANAVEVDIKTKTSVITEAEINFFTAKRALSLGGSFFDINIKDLCQRCLVFDSLSAVSRVSLTMRGLYHRKTTSIVEKSPLFTDIIQKPLVRVVFLCIRAFFADSSPIFMSCFTLSVGQ